MGLRHEFTRRGAFIKVGRKTYGPDYMRGRWVRSGSRPDAKIWFQRTTGRIQLCTFWGRQGQQLTRDRQL